jgi:hypothetical protein
MVVERIFSTANSSSALSHPRRMGREPGGTSLAPALQE